METNFNFKSSVCTDRNQSERLLALGLKPETADMCHRTNGMGIYFITALNPLDNPNDIPAWSLHRLIEMMPPLIKGFYTFSLIYDIKNNTIGYVSANGVPMQSFKGINIFDNIIFAIKWLIEERYFYREYLV